MSEHGNNFDAAQRSHDQAEPDYMESEECEICIFYRFGQCRAKGETAEHDCPSFKD